MLKEGFVTHEVNAQRMLDAYKVSDQTRLVYHKLSTQRSLIPYKMSDLLRLT